MRLLGLCLLFLCLVDKKKSIAGFVFCVCCFCVWLTRKICCLCFYVCVCVSGFVIFGF